MTYRDLLAVVASTEKDAHVLDCAAALAKDHDAFASGLSVNWIPALPTVVEGWAVDARWADLVEEARTVAKQEREALEKALQNRVDRCAADSVLIEIGAAREVLALRARHADLTLVSRPEASGPAYGRTTILEAVLFGAGRPVLVVPPEWKSGRVGHTVVVAWNAGREAARALADAAPLMDKASKVKVVTVDAKPSSSGHGELPGMDITAHLARRGVEVELTNVDSTGRSESDAILDEAVASEADLLVMGGYGRSRMSELVFGGVTRDMLSKAKIPVLMSH